MSNFIVNPNLIIIYSHACHPIRFDPQFQIIDHPHIRYIITISSRMQAPQPGPPSSSNITVEFGEQIQDKCEVDVAIDFFVNSHKVLPIRCRTKIYDSMCRNSLTSNCLPIRF